MPKSFQSLSPTFYNSMSATLDALADDLRAADRAALADRADHVAKECQWAATYIRHGGAEVAETHALEGHIAVGIAALKRAAKAAGARLQIRDDGDTVGLTGTKARDVEHKARVKRSRQTAQAAMAEWLAANPGALAGLGMQRGAKHT